MTVHRLQRVRGFSVVELLIALAILAVVLVQMLAMFTSQHQNYHAQTRVVAAQEDARLAADMVLADVRLAGFMVPAFAGISSRDGGTGNADTLCVSDPEVLDDATVVAATARFDRARVTALANAGDGSVTIAAGHADIDADGSDDFGTGRGVIVSDGSATHCALVTSVGATSISFAPPLAVAIAASSGRAVPATYYELTGDGLERNGNLLSHQVEDLQVEFWVDGDGDGAIDAGEFPVHDISASDTNRIELVQLSVLTRTSSEDPSISGSGRQQVANRAASATPDAYRRRLSVVRVSPRNFL